MGNYGVLDNKVVEVMIDSGSPVSLVRENLVLPNHELASPPEGLKSAVEPISVLGKVTTSIQLGSV